MALDLLQLNPRRVIPYQDVVALREWSAFARCKGLPPEWFYDDSYKNGNNPKAMQICMECPVKNECAEWGMKYEDHGVWGGMTAAQRKTRRRREQYGYR